MLYFAEKVSIKTVCCVFICIIHSYSCVCVCVCVYTLAYIMKLWNDDKPLSVVIFGDGKIFTVSLFRYTFYSETL